MNEQDRKDRIVLEVLIDLACDADYRSLSTGRSMAARLAIASALEVIEEEA